MPPIYAHAKFGLVESMNIILPSQRFKCVNHSNPSERRDEGLLIYLELAQEDLKRPPWA